MVEADKETYLPLESRVIDTINRALKNKGGRALVPISKKRIDLGFRIRDELYRDVQQILTGSGLESGYFHRHVAAATEILIHRMGLSEQLTTNLKERSSYDEWSVRNSKFVSLSICRRDKLKGLVAEAPHGFITTIQG